MKTPISINERGNIERFNTLQEAEAEMEPIDVENGEYVVTDADGNALNAEVVIEEIPVFWGLWKSRIKRVRIHD